MPSGTRAQPVRAGSSVKHASRERLLAVKTLLVSRVETLEHPALRSYVPSRDHALVVEPTAVSFIRVGIAILVILPAMKQSDRAK
jgi:hypothetical protein